jgi:hypothetical protein
MATPLKEADSSDFRRYLDERFNSLHFRLDTIASNQEDTDLSVKELSHIVDTMRQLELTKCMTCVNTKELKDVIKKVDEIFFIKKYYKPFLVTMAVTLGSMLYTGNEAYTKVKTAISSEAAKSEAEKAVLLEKIKENAGVINNNAEIQKDQLKREQKTTKL